MTLIYLQTYWWLLISVLGALLVFLLFVQGGQSMLLETNNPLRRDLIVNSMGRKWELTFTTLVTFGGAFFASFTFSIPPASAAPTGSGFSSSSASCSRP